MPPAQAVPWGLRPPGASVLNRTDLCFQSCQLSLGPEGGVGLVPAMVGKRGGLQCFKRHPFHSSQPHADEQQRFWERINVGLIGRHAQTTEVLGRCEGHASFERAEEPNTVWLERCKANGWLADTGVVALDEHLRAVPLNETLRPVQTTSGGRDIRTSRWLRTNRVLSTGETTSPELQALPASVWPKAYEIQGRLVGQSRGTSSPPCGCHGRGHAEAHAKRPNCMRG